MQRSRMAAFGLVLLAGLTVWATAAFAQRPVNTTPPSITGDARQGETLTAQNGTWENNPTTFQYQWLRCGAGGAGCRNITGATGRTYRVTANDVGSTIRVRVTAVNAEGATNARSAPTEVVTGTGGGGGVNAPRNTQRPTISGEVRVGQQLTATTGEWSGNPTAFAFQWQRCDATGTACLDVSGATGRTYGVRTVDLGSRLRVEVTARNASGSATATSVQTGIVAPTTPITNRRPSLSILGVRFTGARIYVRVRICDDASRNLRILVQESRPRVRSRSLSFSTRVPPRACGAYTRNWLPAQRFRGPGRYTITLRVRDTSGLTSSPQRRTFRR
jgi:hypothetical protein